MTFRCKQERLKKRTTLIAKMFWQIYVLTDTQSSVQIIVSENCLITELVDKCEAHPHIPKGSSYRFYTSDGLSFQNDEKNAYKRLSDFQLKNKSSVNLSVGLAGGVWPTEKEIRARPRNPKPSQRYEITYSSRYPDILRLDDDSPRVIMPCKHAIAPSSLAHHCFHELKNNKPEIRCPAEKCTFVWPFSLIREAACLSVEETVAFEQKLLINRQSRQVKQCPNCFVSCHRERDENKRVICLNCKSKGEVNFEFCWGCLHEWKGRGDDICGNPDCNYESKLFKILAKCTTKELLGVKCPSSRACPNCFLIIEHIKNCKHMTCKSCRYEFCFMCLKTHNWLSQSYELCEVAPRQGSGLCEVSPRQGSGISDSSESSCVII